MKKAIFTLAVLAALSTTATADTTPKKSGYNYKKARRHAKHVTIWQKLNGRCKDYRMK
jgi:hypothetical protein